MNQQGTQPITVEHLLYERQLTDSPIIRIGSKRSINNFSMKHVLLGKEYKNASENIAV
jgi:hypothetical protein